MAGVKAKGLLGGMCRVHSARTSVVSTCDVRSSKSPTVWRLDDVGSITLLCGHDWNCVCLLVCCVCVCVRVRGVSSRFQFSWRHQCK